MKELIIDGKNIHNKEIFYMYIRRQLDSCEYYGDNLDALWDVLSTYDKHITIRFINKELLIENLADYGQSIINVFQDGAEENHNISLEISD